MTLEKPPEATNLRVGGERVTWHGAPLDDLSDLIESDMPDAQVVPIMEGPAEEVFLKSVAAAQFGLDVVKVKEHTCRLAFTMTDFKLQGRTLPKLILGLDELGDLAMELGRGSEWNVLQGLQWPRSGARSPARRCRNNLCRCWRLFGPC